MWTAEYTSDLSRWDSGHFRTWYYIKFLDIALERKATQSKEKHCTHQRSMIFLKYLEQRGEKKRGNKICYSALLPLNGRIETLFQWLIQNQSMSVPSRRAALTDYYNMTGGDRTEADLLDPSPLQLLGSHLFLKLLPRPFHIQDTVLLQYGLSHHTLICPSMPLNSLNSIPQGT